MDKVFKALADATRHGPLDELLKENGQTLSATGGAGRHDAVGS